MSRVFVQYKDSGWFKIHDREELWAFDREKQTFGLAVDTLLDFPLFARVEQDGDDACIELLTADDLLGLTKLLEAKT